MKHAKPIGLPDTSGKPGEYQREAKLPGVPTAALLSRGSPFGVWETMSETLSDLAHVRTIDTDYSGEPE